MKLTHALSPPPVLQPKQEEQRQETKQARNLEASTFTRVAQQHHHDVCLQVVVVFTLAE